MQNWPVNWANGMFLRPHHFQAADRYWHDRVSRGENWTLPCFYGLRSIRLSEEALANQHVEVSACQARLRDGTLVEFDVGQEPDRVKIRPESLISVSAGVEEALNHSPTLMVYLAVPKLSLGRANIAEEGGQGLERFHVANVEVPDENLGGNDQELSFKLENVRLLLESDDTSGFETIPIARIKRSGDKEGAPQLDETYIPPVIDIEAWPQLSRGIIRPIYDFIGQHVRALGDLVRGRGMQAAVHDPRDLQRVWMLSALNESYATLRCLTLASGIHPFTAYLELCRIVGGLSIFGQQRAVEEEIPPYDHDNLAYIFGWIKVHIEQLIQEIPPDIYDQSPFIGAGKGMRVALNAKWFSDAWDWYVGVLPTNIEENECRELLAPGKLNWKMGSVEQVDWLFERNAKGIELQPLQQVPHPLPSAATGWVFYRVVREGPAWQHVHLTKTLGVRFAEHLIRNLDDLEGQQELSVSHQGKPAVLRFSLFAVQKPTAG